MINQRTGRYGLVLKINTLIFILQRKQELIEAPIEFRNQY